MNKANLKLAQKHLDILTFRDLSDSTIKACSTYLNQFLNWAEAEFPDVPVSEIDWDGYRAYVKYLQSVRKSQSPSIYVAVINRNVAAGKRVSGRQLSQNAEAGSIRRNVRIGAREIDLPSTSPQAWERRGR